MTPAMPFWETQAFQNLLFVFFGTTLTALGGWIVNKLGTANKKQDLIAQVADNTHTLVNSQMGQQLQLNATTSRTLANLTQLPADKLAADQAAEKLDNHVKRQVAADENPAAKAYQPNL
jgi:hypothetical protein